jgi:hypothetical protein
VIPAELPEPIRYEAHRDYVRRVLADEVDLRSVGTRYVRVDEGESPETIAYRDRINASGSPSDTVATAYTWKPGTELASAAAGRA